MSDVGMKSHLECAVELQVSAPDDGTMNKVAADALRKAAALVESGQLEDGFLALTDSSGRKIGEIYVDYSESLDEGTSN